MSVKPVERPSAFNSTVLMTVTGDTRAEVLDASIQWRNQHWGYAATITEPELLGDVWVATGSRWSSL